MKILIVGSGGREHAISWSLAREGPEIDLFIAPGNGGTDLIGSNVPIAADDIRGIVEFSRANGIDVVIIGPEVPLVLGLADRLRECDIPVVGPGAEAARLEGSKAFAKSFMERHDIPTAGYRTFGRHELSEALAYVKEQGAPIVVKASGLAAGKGAIVCSTENEAIQSVTRLLETRDLGNAGDVVVIESFMEGEEASVFVLTDGSEYVLLHSAQDHKRIGEGDTGPNTGGMGAYAPAPVMSPELTDRVCRIIIEPTLAGMMRDGYPYQGILYCGLMITPSGPRVVEFNCRLGDPETQVVLPLLKSSTVELFERLASGRLGGYQVESRDGSAACVVMASGGYPGNYNKGHEISGLDEIARMSDTCVFHAGTVRNSDGVFETSGGRVLSVTGFGATLEEALATAYGGVNRIHFKDSYFRRDIGRLGLARSI